MDGSQKWKILRLHVEDGIPLASLARETGVGERTLSRWHSLYRTGGISALERAQRADAGVRRTAPELVAFVEHLALTKPRPSIATLHRLAVAEAARRGVRTPSYATVRSVVQALDPGMVTLALEGPASYRDRHELVFRHRAERPNALWQVDHTELDILIKDPSGNPSRPWLTTVMDDYSRAICGYMVFEGAPSAMNTALALRQAIWPKSDPAWPMCGIPDVLYVDHGSDFTSHHLEYTAIALKIRVIHSAVARPQGRGKIERFFHTVNTELLATLSGRLTLGHPHPVPVLDLPGLDRAVGEFVGQYNQRTHTAIRTSPKAAWIAEGWLPRLPESLEELDGLLLRVSKHRTVQRDGIHFQGQRYLSPTLASFVGRTVTIRYDPRDLSEIRVYDHDTFVCIAVDEAHPNDRLSLNDIERARRARRHQLRKAINDRIPTTAIRTDPNDASPAVHRRRQLRTYEEE